MDDLPERVSFTASLVTQRSHRFYTLTMPSEILGQCSYVIKRDEDPILGFQRLLDEKRATAIADYIDNGEGTIPNSIVLSAQSEAEFSYNSRLKTVEFRPVQRAFMILDGQHRVYGFRLAKSTLRVPVVIYSELSRKQETRLFIDINTKQKPVPNELLLDIRKLAEYQDDADTKLGMIFDLFNNLQSSPLLGRLSASQKKSGFISRVTFNAGLKSVIDIFGNRDHTEIYEIVAAYLTAFISLQEERNLNIEISTPSAFRGSMMFLEDIAKIVKAEHQQSYTAKNFKGALRPVFDNLKRSSVASSVKNPGVFHNNLKDALNSSFKL